MNKAITEGIVFMPTTFEEGLDVWSSGDGTPGSDTYDGSASAAFVPADADFGGCLELLKGSSTQKLRYMGQTPMIPGCYLRITARVKAISGNLPAVRIAGWAGKGSNVHVSGVTEVGPSTTLTSYGEVVEVMAIVGSGNRPGVDMVWGTEPGFGYFGLDLTGANGGVVRIDDIVIEDITNVFLRDMLAWVDVRDYGAIGDGVTDDLAAFEAADAAANGRMVMVSEGTYHLADSMTFENRVRFEGTVTMPASAVLSLQKDFHLPAYIDAFGDEELAFKKAFQSLLNNSGHESLDLCGRRISVTGPIDMQAAVNNKTTYATRRHIRNGQFDSQSGTAWDTTTVTSQATYNPANANTLTGVTNVANIPVGSLVVGNGVGREVYVTAKNVGAQTLTLAMPLYDAAGTQTFTFKRFKYLLDFSSFEHLDKFSMSDIEFQCNGECSAILLPPSGLIFHLRDCFITRPKDRGITSHGTGCQGMLIDRCQFLSDESSSLSQNRVSIALNTNANDVKLRDNRVVHFRHFAVLGGTGSIITGNHWFQGDSASEGVRTGGIVLTRTNARATINGNYIDNNFIEWANEHDEAPEFSSEFSFSGLSITDNIFLSSDVAPWFTFIVVKPHGTGHYLNGMAVTGNIFRNIHGNIDRVESVDTTFADLDWDKVKNVTFSDNMFNSVSTTVSNPLTLKHAQATPSSVWTLECAPYLPFGGWAQTVESLVANGKIATVSNVAHWGMPYVKTKEGTNKDKVTLTWEKDVSGDVTVLVRIDDPL
ncbi:glycosyl hydrolase family 28-related protein [Pseudooceanicola nanhaiensis]|uniref:glycosyl hydrolase family 28-related protein n=1 Tax=Pseudooceanicola nanhaiensis TaxID=375761 RepID=UPI001CD44A8D|nr:glycosyl hydrolase family 28-related protein [Pseudooceanicola nanhaiensis]MCA0919057.1 right-handed parallel beta-helix repeat-containing protein [Pseudooceanicola nanhaiensis]